MNKKKTMRIIIGVLLLIFFLIGSFVIILYKYKRKKTIIEKMPYIVFCSNTTRMDDVFVCANGDIYLGYTEDSFIMPIEEIEKRIINNQYEGLLVYLGNCGVEETMEMYNLFYEVCVNDTYRFTGQSYIEPKNNDEISENEAGYNSISRNWYGFYLDNNGENRLIEIYISNKGYECSDKRAYKIIEWMYDCLVKYADF